MKSSLTPDKFRLTGRPPLSSQTPGPTPGPPSEWEAKSQASGSNESAPSTHLPDHLGSSLFEGPIPQTGQRWLRDPGHPSQGLPRCPRWHDSGAGVQGFAHCTSGINPRDGRPCWPLGVPRRPEYLHHNSHHHNRPGYGKTNSIFSLHLITHF